MKQWLIAATACFALVACEQHRQVAGPAQLSANVTGSDAQIYIVNFDETQTTEAAVTAAILNAGAGAVQVSSFSMVAALATPAQLVSDLDGSTAAGVCAVERGSWIRRRLRGGDESEEVGTRSWELGVGSGGATLPPLPTPLTG